MQTYSVKQSSICPEKREKREGFCVCVCVRMYTGASATIYIVSECKFENTGILSNCHWMVAQHSPCLVPPKSNTCPPHC